MVGQPVATILGLMPRAPPRQAPVVVAPRSQVQLAPPLPVWAPPWPNVGPRGVPGTGYVRSLRAMHNVGTNTAPR